MIPGMRWEWGTETHAATINIGCRTRLNHRSRANWKVFWGEKRFSARVILGFMPVH